MGRILTTVASYPCASCRELKRSKEFLFEYVMRYTLGQHPIFGVSCEYCRRAAFTLEWGTEKDVDPARPWLAKGRAPAYFMNLEREAKNTRALLDIRGKLVGPGRPPHTMDCGRCKQEFYMDGFPTPHPKHAQTHCVDCLIHGVRNKTIACPISKGWYWHPTIRDLCAEGDVPELTSLVKAYLNPNYS